MVGASGDLRRVWPPPTSIVVEYDGLVLREWVADDAPAMVELFDTAEMDRRTPLESPFTLDAAHRYVRRAHRLREEAGAVQLAITDDGTTPLGEVLAFPADVPGAVECAYAVGVTHRRRGLARRAVSALLPGIAAAGFGRAVLLIADDNPASRSVAESLGFVRTEAPLVERQRKGYVLRLVIWERVLRGDGHDDPMARRHR
jgi:RimJ/RimL family protein N-acetyltransferase